MELITKSEMKIMHILWDSHNPLSTEQLMAKLVEEPYSTNWSRSTTSTFISRLKNKNLISGQRLNKRMCYYPLLEEIDYYKIFYNKHRDWIDALDADKFILFKLGKDISYDNLKLVSKYLSQIKSKAK